MGARGLNLPTNFFNAMTMGNTQRDIIRQTFGITTTNMDWLGENIESTMAHGWLHLRNVKSTFGSDHGSEFYLWSQLINMANNVRGIYNARKCNGVLHFFFRYEDLKKMDADWQSSDSILMFCLIAWLYEKVPNFRLGDDGNVVLST